MYLTRFLAPILHSPLRISHNSWRSTLSYMELRNMQVETNFIRRNATSGLQQCIRSSKIYDAIVCPPGIQHVELS